MENINNYKKNISILLVEDDYATQVKLVSILSKMYKNIIVAKNGDDALAIFRNYYLSSKRFDLIISDINMPIMDGIELLENIRQIDLYLPFIFVTAQLNLENLLKVIRLDVDDYVLKPIEIDVLKESIDKTIKKKFQMNFFSSKKQLIKLNEDLSWDFVEKAIYYKDEAIKLTKNEIVLLDLLCNNIGNILNTEVIIYTLWGDDSLSVNSNIANLKNLISRLRIKIPSLGINNIYGLGYSIKVEK